MKKNFFAKIKKSLRFDEEFFDEDDAIEPSNPTKESNINHLTTIDTDREKSIWPESDDTYGELSVDVYETESDIIVQAMIAGTKPDGLDITLSRDMISIKGKREDTRKIDDSQFVIKELYWGSFARTISLPQEVDIELVDAIEKHGLLTLRLPKIDKGRQTTVKIKSI